MGLIGLITMTYDIARDDTYSILFTNGATGRSIVILAASVRLLSEVVSMVSTKATYLDSHWLPKQPLEDHSQ